MSVAVVLFTSDLRVHDHPALRAAQRAGDSVVPLFVRDRGIEDAGFTAPNRLAFLADCLGSLDEQLRSCGGRLIVRHGDVVDEVVKVATETGARQVHLSGGVSGYAHRREERLREALDGLTGQVCTLHVHDAVITTIAPGQVTPTGRDHFAVFTPYLRRWEKETLRTPEGAPRTLRVPADLASDPLPERPAAKHLSPALAPGGETEARRRFAAWLDNGIDDYDTGHDDLAADATSRLSPYIHFGCLSPVELVRRARERGGAGAEAFVRQLAWRDFHHQVIAARPTAAHADYRSKNDRWRSDEREIAAWREGRTGYPMVDAAMRQLAHEGWMHNRGRLIVGSFLTKTLYADWRIGARHFLSLLVDGDLANNQMNWQWMAGTGTDTRPNRVLNPVVQGKRLDPQGDYVRRWVPELADLAKRYVHEPWELPEGERAKLDYPDPIVDLSEARSRFEAARG
ncbi:cryptochrome/photolyase family protein [Streptomyces sp. NPDC060194]|uniref:cryptochrome/photolyase family protein n=1 Tax=Streptomyces sp. NPDC060194 TaxID=3347069 RepID=UPI00365CEBE2